MLKMKLIDLLVLPCVLASAQVSHAVTLLDSINAARGFDAGFSAAGNARMAGREKRWQGIAGLLPRAQLEGSYAKQDQPGAAYATAVRRHSIAASVTQPIFDMPRFADVKRGIALATLADIEFEKSQQDLMVRVSDAYFDVLYQREVLQAAVSAKLAFQKQLDQATAALRLGEGTRTDVDEAQANLDLALASAVAALTDLEIAGGTYRRLTGLSADEVEAVGLQCMPSAMAADMEAAMEEAARDNLEVRIAEQQAEQAGADVAAAVGANLPVVSAQASYGTNWSYGAGENRLDAIFGTTSKTRSSTIGVTITIPLFAGGAQLSAGREAYSRRAQARDALEDARRRARESARAAYLGMTNGGALVQARQRALGSAEGKVKSTRLGREVGMRTNIDELNAQQRYFEAVRDLASARYKHLRARLQLSAALGSLGDADVAALACHQHKG